MCYNNIVIKCHSAKCIDFIELLLKFLLKFKFNYNFFLKRIRLLKNFKFKPFDDEVQ